MGGKSGGGGKSYDYFGTIAGVVCAGPVDELVAIVVDGKTVWPKATGWEAGIAYTVGALAQWQGVVYECVTAHTSSSGARPPNANWIRYTVKRSASPNPLPVTVENYGAAYLYWGTATQTLDTVGEKTLDTRGHPAYRRQCVLVLKAFLFGRERTSAPNVEVIVRRKPSQAMLTGDPAALTDGQANPMAAAADLFTDPVFGAGLAPDTVGGPDLTTWQATANALQADMAKVGISPSLQRGQTLRQFAASLLAYHDGWLRFGSSGEIEAGRFPHNAAPPVFTAATTIDYHDLIEEVAYTAAGWADTANQTQVRFTDRERSFKDASVAAVSGYNLAVTGEPRTATIDRPWITRRQQASDHAAEWQKVNAEPRISGSLVVRAEKAESIRQGDLFLLTHDALAVSVVCRCVEKSIAAPPAGRVTIQFESDRAGAQVPFQPTAPAGEGAAFPANETLSLQQFVQPPPTMIDGTNDASVVALVARTSPVTVGCNVWLQQADLSGFYLLGSIEQFAIYGTLQQAYNPTMTYATASRARASNVATITTATAHGLTPGMTVVVSGVGGTGYNGTVSVASTPSSTSFTYSNAGTTETTTTDTGGTVDPGNDDTTEALRVTLDAGTDAGDLAKMLQTQTEDAIADNAVAVFVFDAGNAKTFEVLTLRAMRIASGETFYRVKARRARFGTSRRSAATGDRVFIAYRSDLVELFSQQFAANLQNLSTSTFRLQAVNADSVADLADATLCPNITYTFADPYAPTFTFDSVKANGVEATNFSTNYAATVEWEVEATITDASADLVGARLFARAGSQELSIWSATYTPSSKQAVVTRWKFPNNGTWEVFLSGVDRSGRVRQKQLTAGGGNTSVAIEVRANNDTAAPTFSPPGGGYASGFPLTVTLATSTAGAHIDYQVVNMGAAAGTTWTTINATSGTVSVSAGKRVYARAHTSGQNYSTTVFADYWREVDEYLPPGTQPP